MSVDYSYPGIYIEEIPNTNHTIQPAPTAITCFVGVSHPYQTDSRLYGNPQEIFSFSDYQASFGGFFSCEPFFRDYLGQAVFQFFNNGGSHAWVVALDPGDIPPAPVANTQYVAVLNPVILQDIKTHVKTLHADDPLSVALKNYNDALNASAGADQAAQSAGPLVSPRLTNNSQAENEGVKVKAAELMQAWVADSDPTAAEARNARVSPAEEELNAKHDDRMARLRELCAEATNLSQAEQNHADAVGAATSAMDKARAENTRPMKMAASRARKSTADALRALSTQRQTYDDAVTSFAAATKAHAEAAADLARVQAQVLSKAGTVTFTAKEPVNDSTPYVSKGLPMSVTVTPNDDEGKTADIVITYGPHGEIYRRVEAGALGEALKNSRLVTVSGGAADFKADPLTQTLPFSYPNAPGSGTRTEYLSPGAFGNVFLPPTKSGDSQGVARIPIFNIMCLPGMTGSTSDERMILQQGLTCCEQNRAFLIVDTPSALRVDLTDPKKDVPIDTTNVKSYFQSTAGLGSTYGAIFFPHLTIVDPVTLADSESPPCGFVAGAFARQDAQYGVYTTAAGYQALLSGVRSGVVDDGRMSDPEQGVLNQAGVNCIRQFPGVGSVIFGGRTLVAANTSFEQWKYIAVRRMALFLEDSLYGSLGWAIFRPNARPLWTAIKTEVDAFMAGLYRNSAFAGDKPSDAYRVVCDETTTTDSDINLGVVNILVAFAPLKPAEFVVVKIAQLAGQTSV